MPLTRSTPPSHNATVAFVRGLRRFVTGLASLSILSLAFLPPEHLHITRTHHGHHSDVIHRHYTPHHSAASHKASVGDEDADQPRWLDSSFINVNPATQSHPIDRCLHLEIPSTRPRVTWLGSIGVDHPSIHDPPPKTSPGLRAPPSLPV